MTSLISPLHAVSDQPAGETPAHDDDPVDSLHYDMTIAIANIRTLASEDMLGRITPAKQQLLMCQFAEAGCHVVAVQETQTHHPAAQ